MLDVNQINTNTHSGFRPTLFSKEAMRQFQASTVIADKVWRKDKEVSQFGQAVTINRISNLEAQDKQNNVQVSLQSPTEGSVTLSVNKWKYAAILIDDFIKAQSTIELTAEYMSPLSYAIRKAVETDLFNLATGFSQSAGTYNTALTEDAILDAIELLEAADVPLEDNYFFVRHNALRDLRDIDDYTRFDGTGYAGASAMGWVGQPSGGNSRPAGLSGMLYNRPIYMSTLVAKSGNNTSNLLMHKDAMALAMQKDLRVQTGYELSYLGNLAVADAMYGVVETRDECGVELRS